MALIFTHTARRFGIASAGSVAALQVTDAATLIIGVLLLESRDEDIGDPMFTLLEVLIVALLLGVLFYRTNPTDTSMYDTLPSSHRGT